MIGFRRLRPNLALAVGGTLTAMLIATAIVSTVWTPEVPTRARRPASQSALGGRPPRYG